MNAQKAVIPTGAERSEAQRRDLLRRYRKKNRSLHSGLRPSVGMTG